MSVATQKNAEVFLDIEADDVLANDYPLHSEDEVEVVYGSQAIKAEIGTDYTVALNLTDFNNFTVTPTAALITKIEALIASPPTEAEETNFVVVRRKIPLTSDAEPEVVRDTAKLANLIDRMMMAVIQVSELLDRSLTLPSNVVGDPLVSYEIDPPIEGFAPVWRGNKLVAEISAPDITNAQEYAEQVAEDLIEMQALLVEMQGLAALLPQNNFNATTAPTVNDDANDGYSVGSEWVNKTNGKRYSCGNATVGAAVWTEISADLSALGTAAYEDTGTFLLAADISTVRSIPKVDVSAAVTLGIAHVGKLVRHPSADVTARTWTVPLNATEAVPVDSPISLYNKNGAGVITIAPEVGVTLRLAGTGDTGNRTLAANGFATLYKDDTNEWVINGVGLT